MVYSNLSSNTQSEIFSLIDVCSNLKDETEFYDVLNKLKALFGQEMATFGVGDIKTMKVISSVNAGYSTEFLGDIVDDSGMIKSPLFEQWLKIQSPQIYNFKKTPCIHMRNNYNPYFEHSIDNIVAHGILDGSGRYTTYFSLACFADGINSHLVDLVGILAPFLHVAYTRLVTVAEPLSTVMASTQNHAELKRKIENDNKNQATHLILSTREIEVLQWLFVGKSNWDISVILCISENTVKNHVQRIIKKLEANNRQHAVAKAIEMKLIEM